MKVIAVTTKKYVVEMEPVELKRLTGHGDSWGVPCNERIGMELAIVPAWNTIIELLNAKASLPATANKLRALADILEPIAVEIPTEKPCQTDDTH
jgi:hypothetical protein